MKTYKVEDHIEFCSLNVEQNTKEVWKTEKSNRGKKQILVEFQEEEEKQKQKAEKTIQEKKKKTWLEDISIKI